jgi:hypothetical protein
VTGGAGWYSTDQQRFVPADAHHDLVTSSAPLSARQWWAAGYSYFNFSTANRFRVALLCAPSSRVGPFSITRQTFDVAPAKVAATYQSCPAGTEIVAAGAYWHEPGQSPQNSPVSNQNLAALAPTLDKKGDWFAGYNLRATSERLTAIVECRLI